jgi:AP-1-like transcription factor
MATARSNILPNFILTPQQQTLLFRALTSNQPSSSKNDQGSLTPDSLTTSPAQTQKNISFNEPEHGLPDSSLIDYDYDIGQDSSFDFDFTNDGVDAQARMIGDLPGTSPESNDSFKDGSKSPENESSDKRSHPDDEEDEEEAENGAKRRESEGKVPKKPGRKPLTNEPSSVSLAPECSTAAQYLIPHPEAKGTESCRSARFSGAEGEAPQGSRDEGRGAREGFHSRE